MKSLSKLLLASALVLASSAYAASESTKTAGSSGLSQSNNSGEAVESSTPMSEGEIKKINKDAGKVTIKHGPLKNLEMPAMSMVFHVKEPAMLEQIKAGDKINFVAEKIGGQFTVTQMEVKK